MVIVPKGLARCFWVLMAKVWARVCQVATPSCFPSLCHYNRFWCSPISTCRLFVLSSALWSRLCLTNSLSLSFSLLCISGKCRTMLLFPKLPMYSHLSVFWVCQLPASQWLMKAWFQASNVVAPALPKRSSGNVLVEIACQVVKWRASSPLPNPTTLKLPNYCKCWRSAATRNIVWKTKLSDIQRSLLGYPPKYYSWFKTGDGAWSNVPLLPSCVLWVLLGLSMVPVSTTTFVCNFDATKQKQNCQDHKLQFLLPWWTIVGNQTEEKHRWKAKGKHWARASSAFT